MFGMQQKQVRTARQPIAIAVGPMKLVSERLLTLSPTSDMLRAPTTVKRQSVLKKLFIRLKKEQRLHASDQALGQSMIATSTASSMSTKRAT